VHFVGLYYSVKKYIRAIRTTDNNKTRRTADGLGVPGNYRKSIDTDYLMLFITDSSKKNYF
jgi:hypothetical protein